MIYADDLMRWYVGTKKNYEAIKPEDIDPNGCYFTIDTREIFLDGICFTGCLVLYQGDKPIFPTPQKLYLNLDNLEVSVFKGDKWVVLFSALTTEFISADPNETPTANWVSGGVIKDYAKRLIVDTIHDMTYHDIRYNSNTNTLTLMIGDLEQNIVISHIANKMIVDSNSSTLYILDAENNVLASEVIYPKHTISGDYDFKTDKLVFTFSTGDKLYVDAKPFVNIHGSVNTRSVITTLDKGNRTLQMDVKISQIEDNGLEARDDGLFYDLVNKMDKIVGHGFANKILTSDANGNSNTGIDIDDVATEYFVYTKINREMLNPYAKHEDVHNYPDFNVYMGTAEEVFAILKYPETQPGNI